MSDDQTVWVRTDVADHGGYVVTLDAGRGRTRRLTPSAGMKYAAGVLAVAAQAEHDALVAQQLRESLQRTSEHDVLPLVASVIDSIRNDRPSAKPSDTHPIRLAAGISPTLQPFITVTIAGDTAPSGQFTVDDARNHALVVIEAATVADLDSAYYRALRSSIGLDEKTARAMVAELLERRPESAGDAV